MTSSYDQYANFVGDICALNDLSFFKSHRDFVYMLEHVTPEQGQQYLDVILRVTHLSEKDIKEFCELNDSLGRPRTGTYSFGTVSPTNLRYILQAHLILTHIYNHSLKNPDIIELGGGYGGLCLAIHFFAPRYLDTNFTYTIIDLPNIINLQKKYLEKVTPGLNVKFYPSTNFGAEVPLQNAFLISNYCFSEICLEYQKEYIKNLFPKISHGFMVWNAIPLYNFGFPVVDVDEYPCTAENPRNKYVYF